MEVGEKAVHLLLLVQRQIGEPENRRHAAQNTPLIQVSAFSLLGQRRARRLGPPPIGIDAARFRTLARGAELTQEYLAEMLGVRRSTVTVVAGTLQQAGLIYYRRGAITILDRRRLEATVCECGERIPSCDASGERLGHGRLHALRRDMRSACSTVRA